MIRVRLFGLLRLDSGIRELTLEAATVAQVKKELLTRSERMDKRKLDGCLILVNGKQAGHRTKLTDGDEVIFMSPVAGG